MNIIKRRRDVAEGAPALNRRRTFMLAVASIVGMATPSHPARAGLRGTKPPSAPQLADLKAVGPQGQVTGILQRGETFEVATADGRGSTFRATDLRFKIDTTEKGPAAGRPVILCGGMMGDRASVFFASAAEIGLLIKHAG